MGHLAYFFGCLALMPLAGCVASTDKRVMNVQTDGCSVSRSTSWQAWLEPVVGQNPSKVLRISGEVDMPTPGYVVTLESGPADRAMPPSQRFRLKAEPPSGMVAQIITPTAVTFRKAATYPAYRSIVILCGERVLATITEVPSR